MALRLYSAALRTMAEVIERSQEFEVIDIDSVMNALFLMALYELLPGDDRYRLATEMLGKGVDVGKMLLESRSSVVLISETDTCGMMASP